MKPKSKESRWNVLPQLVRETEKKQRWALTLLVTGIVMGIFVTTLLVTIGIMLILIKAGALSDDPVVLTEGTKLLLIVAGACTIVGIALTFLLIRIPLSPVNKVINAFNKLASGDFSARISFGKPLCDHPTAQEFSASFNVMASELDKTEMLRSDFINNFSHEFKAPIASIAGFAKLLKKPGLSEAQTREYLDIIEEESLRLSHMATNVLNLNKVESQTILTDVTRFNLSEQIRGCVLLMDNQLEAKQLDLDLDFDEIPLMGSEDLLKQVWINLLDNAIKFSPVGGKVTVCITKDTDSRTVTVRIGNLGAPIPEELRDEIFRKFYQIDTSKSVQGNGIGLAIVHQVTALHHGSVRADCRDGETSFYVTLPTEQ